MEQFLIYILIIILNIIILFPFLKEFNLQINNFILFINVFNFSMNYFFQKIIIIILLFFIFINYFIIKEINTLL